MNREDIKPGDCLKLSYIGQDDRTGIGFVSEKEGKITINIFWKDCTVSVQMPIESLDSSIEIRRMVVEKERFQPDFIHSQWDIVKGRRDEFLKMDIDSSCLFDIMREMLFDGLEPGDIICNIHNDEIIKIESLSPSIAKGYLLKSNGKWGTKKTTIYGLYVGYNKLVRI